MITKPVLRLVSLALLWVFIALLTSAATLPELPIPGTSFETAKSLGLTAKPNGAMGIHLKTNDDLGYYFYLAPNRDIILTFTFYTYQPVSTYESKLRNRIALLTIYDTSRRTPSSSKTTFSCTSLSTSPSGKACTATLESSLKRGQKYYLFVDFHTFDNSSEGRLDTREYDGWLAWEVSKTKINTIGTSATQAWTWFDRNALHGQIDGKGEHWYLLNASAGSQLEFSLWGSGGNLDLCIYRADKQARLSCQETTTYPETITLNIPKDLTGEGTLFVKVSNNYLENSEYYLSYTRK